MMEFSNIQVSGTHNIVGSRGNLHSHFAVNVDIDSRGWVAESKFEKGCHLLFRTPILWSIFQILLLNKSKVLDSIIVIKEQNHLLP